MLVQAEAYRTVIQELAAIPATLVAVSKTKPAEAVKELYDLGHRDFGENYVQELLDKQAALPRDVRWHFIGHLQTNKVKYIASFVHLVHGVDSRKLLKEINKQAARSGRVINVLLQVHIAREETKFGFNEKELDDLLNAGPESELPALTNVRLTGLMGMASFTDDAAQVRSEFKTLKGLYQKYAGLPLPNVHFQTLSMGMSADYKIALEEGSTMVRIGSLLFGNR